MSARRVSGGSDNRSSRTLFSTKMRTATGVLRSLPGQSTCRSVLGDLAIGIRPAIERVFEMLLQQQQATPDLAGRQLIGPPLR